MYQEDTITRTLPGAITTALAAAGAQPSLSVQVQNLTTQFKLLTNGGPLSGRAFTLLTSANTILRFVVSQAANPNTIYLQRITSPGTAGQWTAAGTLITSNARGDAGVAIAQTGSTIRLFYYNHAADTIVYRDSTNDGVTWGAETATLASPWALPNLCFGLFAPDINMVTVASAAFGGFDLAAALMYRTIYSGGVWGAWANVGPATPSWGQIRGLSCYKHSNGYTYVVGGIQMRTLRTGCAAGTFTEQYPSAPNTYSAWSSIASMDNKNLGLTYAYPHLSFDPVTGNFYVAAMLQDDGTASGVAQDRVGVFVSTDGITYRLAGWIGSTMNGSVCTATVAGVVYVFDANNTYTMGPSGAALDVSADVLAIRIVEKPNLPQAITLVLANNAGQYTGISNIAPNATVSIALGYNGTTIATHTAYIDSFTLTASPENLTCEISGRSVSKLLEQVISRALIYSNQTITQLARAIALAAGITLDPLPVTSQFSQSVPCFMLQPGDTWATALNRLSNVYGFSWFDRGAPSVTIVEAAPGDPSTWSYTTDMFGVVWAQHADQATLIRVIGQSGTTTPAFADLTDDTAILISGGERYRHIVDRNLTTSAQARIRAQRALREEQQHAATGVLTVSLNPAHELLDVVTATDSRVGLAAQAMRIHGIDWHIDMQSGEWLQHLHVQLP